MPGCVSSSVENAGGCRRRANIAANKSFGTPGPFDLQVHVADFVLAGRHVRAFDVQPDGSLTNDRVFIDMRGDAEGVPDGMKVDVEGNVYCTGPGGVWILDPAGNHLGNILTGADQTTNCCWGGDDWKTLFITTRETVGRIQMKIAGIPVPRGPIA